MGITERKEKEKAEMKQLILEASVRLFSEHGLEGISIRKIAELIEYSPTTVYLYYKDKNEILFDLHEIGFKKMAAYNQELEQIKNPIVRLHKLGENYIRFGLNNPEYYDLMFLVPAPMEVIHRMDNCEWRCGDDALNGLKSLLQECMDKKLILPGDINAIAMAIWSMVHGLVSLAIRQRLKKLVENEDIVTAMHRSLTWMMNSLEKPE